METSVLEIKNNGLEVHLMNGSRWSVNVGDISKSITWYPTQRILIEESEDDIYPYILTNLDTFAPDKIRVSRIL
jgi:hypothetical protein